MFNAIFYLIILTCLPGCQLFDGLYVDAKYTHGTWTGTGTRILVCRNEDPKQLLSVSGLHILKGPEWKSPAHPERYNIVTGWYVPLTDEQGIALPLAQVPVGATVEAQGLMESAALLDSQKKLLADPRDPKLKPFLVRIAVKRIKILSPPPAGTVDEKAHLQARPIPLSPTIKSKASLSNQKPTTVPTTAPAITLRAEAVSPNQINFVWTPIKSATGYKIEISHDGKDFYDSATVDANGADAQDDVFEPGDIYYFRVTAIGPDGNLAVSNVVRVQTPREPASTKPLILPHPTSGASGRGN